MDDHSRFAEKLYISRIYLFVNEGFVHITVAYVRVSCPGTMNENEELC